MKLLCMIFHYYELFGKANYPSFVNVVRCKSSKCKTRSYFYYLFFTLQTFFLYKYYPSTLKMPFEIFREGWFLFSSILYDRRKGWISIYEH